MNREGPGKMEFEALKKAMATILGMDPNEIEMDMNFWVGMKMKMV